MKSPRPESYFSVKQAAWILGVPESDVAMGIRKGWISCVRRRSRLVIPAAEVARLLDDADACTGDGCRPNGGGA